MFVSCTVFAARKVLLVHHTLHMFSLHVKTKGRLIEGFVFAHVALEMLLIGVSGNVIIQFWFPVVFLTGHSGHSESLVLPAVCLARMCYFNSCFLAARYRQFSNLHGKVFLRTNTVLCWFKSNFFVVRNAHPGKSQIQGFRPTWIVCSIWSFSQFVVNTKAQINSSLFEKRKIELHQPIFIRDLHVFPPKITAVDSLEDSTHAH